MWAHVSQFPVHCRVKTWLPQPTICVKVLYGKHWSPIAQESTPFHKRTYVKRYIHFMKLFCGAVHLHPLLLSNTNSKHSAISRTACKAKMEAEDGLQKGDYGLGNHQFWVLWVDRILGSGSFASWCLVPINFEVLHWLGFTYARWCRMLFSYDLLRCIYLSLPIISDI